MAPNWVAGKLRIIDLQFHNREEKQEVNHTIQGGPLARQSDDWGCWPVYKLGCGETPHCIPVAYAE